MLALILPPSVNGMSRICLFFFNLQFMHNRYMQTKAKQG